MVGGVSALSGILDREESIFGDGSKFQSRRWGDLNATVDLFWY